MDMCTCNKDKEITCIVHPTTRSLKGRIEELEADNEKLLEAVDSRDGFIKIQEAQLEALREAAERARQLILEGRPMAADTELQAALAGEE